MTAYSMPAPRRSWLGRATDWLDERGRAAWIAAMIVGFITFWPLGLGLLAYITATNRWRKSDMFGISRCSAKSHLARRGFAAMRPSGNSAFDAYKEDTLRRLMDEQEAFESFLQRLREAKDKQEFDTFMADRAKAHAVKPVEGDEDRAF